MVIHSRLKKFVMDMQLRQCVARAKLFRQKKRFCLAFFIFKKSPSALKNPEFQHLATNKTNWQPGFFVSMIPCTSKFHVPSGGSRSQTATVCFVIKCNVWWKCTFLPAATIVVLDNKHTVAYPCKVASMAMFKCAPLHNHLHEI